MVTPVIPAEVYRIPDLSFSRDIISSVVFTIHILCTFLCVSLIRDSTASFFIASIYNSFSAPAIACALLFWPNRQLREATFVLQSDLSFSPDLRSITASKIWRFFRSNSFLIHFFVSFLVYFLTISCFILLVEVDLLSSSLLAASFFLVFLILAPQNSIYNKLYHKAPEYKPKNYNYSPWYLTNSPRRQSLHRALFFVTFLILFFVSLTFRYKIPGYKRTSQIITAYLMALSFYLIVFQFALPFLSNSWLDKNYRYPTQQIPPELILCGSKEDPIVFTRFGTLSAILNFSLSVITASSLITILLVRSRIFYSRSSIAFISETPFLFVLVNHVALLFLSYDGSIKNLSHEKVKRNIIYYRNVPYGSTDIEKYKEVYLYDSMRDSYFSS